MKLYINIIMKKVVFVDKSDLYALNDDGSMLTGDIFMYGNFYYWYKEVGG